MLMDAQIGRAVWEPCSWNGNHFSTCSKTEENQGNSARFGRSQDLPVARWLASSQARWAPVCRSQLQRGLFSTSAHRTENSRRGNSIAVATYPPTHSPTNSPIHSPTCSQSPTHPLTQLSSCREHQFTFRETVAVSWRMSAETGCSTRLNLIQKINPISLSNSYKFLYEVTVFKLCIGLGGSCPTSQWQIVSNML